MTDDELFSRVVMWVAKVTGVPAIRAYQGGEAPAALYIEVNFTGSEDVRQREQRIVYVEDADTADVTASPLIETEWNYSVHAYGENATDVLRKINVARRMQELVQPLGRGVYVHDTSQVRNLNEFQNADWKGRANVDLAIRGVTRDGMIVNVVDEVDFDFETKGSH